MRIVFVETVDFSRHCLQQVLDCGGNGVGVFTLAKEDAGFHSDYADLSQVARQHGIAARKIENIVSTKAFYMNHLGVRRDLVSATLSSTEAVPPRLDRVFMPNVFSEITPTIERKLEIMGFYETEEQSELLPCSSTAIRALARFHGSTIGVECAEAFKLIREVN